ncbi:MAG: TPM domain-containing protein [Rhizobiales bacterium]|nr:TPM domain-containing protein [Hyphomicrobiales bacterium]MBN9009898.1 TPM domain-containing protein [Hyphomicrobiales bacterium]
MPALGEEERAAVRDAIAAAETRTAGEIFVVVARVSDDYRLVPILWATLVALVVPLPLLAWTLLPATTIYLIQLATFILLAILLSLPPIHIHTVPRSVQRGRAHDRAVEQFLAHGLQMTEQRTGALIFVSLAERHAEIVADAGIAAKVPQSTWEEAVAALVAEIRAHRLGSGLVGAVGAVGAVLARHFPPRPDDRDELANDVILL